MDDNAVKCSRGQSLYSVCVRANGESKLAGIVSVIFPLLLSLCQTIQAQEAPFQCTPSGFTIGIPPFHASHDIQTRFQSIAIHSQALQNRLAEILSKSGLFSNVAVLREVPRPDSTDLTLLVSISLIREVEGSGGSNFEVSLSVLLTENLGGRSLFQQTYFRVIRGRFATAGPQGVGPALDVDAAFPAIAVEIGRDLNSTLNRSSDPAISDIMKSRTVTHAALAEMRILHPIVADTRGGPGNYARYIDENLREKLQRKHCFQFSELADTTARCLDDLLVSSSERQLGNLSPCLADTTWHGFLLINWISPVSDSLRIRSVLLTVPGMDVSYDKVFTTVPGWRLGNTLEQHAAGIAQASHGRQH